MHRDLISPELPSNAYPILFISENQAEKAREVVGDRFSAINSEFNFLYKKSILRKSGINSGMLGIVKPMEEQNERQYL